MNSPEIIAHVDGGSRGNPGPAAYGVYIETPQGQAVTAIAKFIGRTTNNFAEYQGLLAALDYALSHGYPRLRVLTDSELMARQVAGHYKVRSPDLKPLFEQAQAMISQLQSFSIRHVYREQNREADRLANEAMDNAERGKGMGRSSPLPFRPSPHSDGSAESIPAGSVPPRFSANREISSREGERSEQQMAPPTKALACEKPVAQPLRVAASFHDGVLHPHTQLPLLDGEEVEIEIRRKK